MYDELVSVVRNRVDEYLFQVSRVREVMIKLANGEASTTQSWDDYAVSVYLAKGKRIVESSYTTRSPVEALRKTLELLDRLEESPLYAELPEPNGDEIDMVDRRIKDAVVTGDTAWLIEELELDSIPTAAGMIRLQYVDRILAGSNGAEYRQEYTLFNGYIRVFKGDASGQWSWTSTVYDRRKAVEAIGIAKSLAEECEKLPRADLEPGKYRVLLSPMTAANLLTHAAMAASAGAIILGFSFLQNWGLGAKIGSDHITIREIPRDSTLPNFSGFDDEGVATRDKEIFEKGVFKTVLHNTKTAKMMGDVTTGNAGWILPRLFNIEVLPGSLSEEEMLEALGDGVYVTNNWYTRFQNYLEGSFSTVTRDATFIIKSGRPVACADRLRIADTLPNLLKSIVDLTKTRYDIQWWEVEDPVRIPYVLVDRLGIVKR